MLIAVRHGSTNFNGDKEKLRGWLDLPLSPEGEKEALESATKLKSLLHDIPIKNFYSSDLLRARQTASEIQDKLGMRYQTTNKLRDWNIGEFSGKPVDTNIDKLNEYLDNPDESVTKGESYNDFYDRAAPFLKRLVESDHNNLGVMHNRLITLIKALSDNGGESPSLQTLKKKGPVEPGGIIAVHPDWSLNVIKR